MRGVHSFHQGGYHARPPRGGRGVPQVLILV